MSRRIRGLGILSGATSPVIVGLDLGSKILGVVISDDAIPLRVIRAYTIEIDCNALGAAADAVCRLIEARSADSLPPQVVVEFGNLYIPAGATPQQARAMAENHERMAILLLLIRQACPGPVYRVDTIARRTWSARVLPRHKGNVSNQEAREALTAWLHPEWHWATLSDQHRIDAAGAVVGWLLGSPKPKRTVERAYREPRPKATAESRAAKALAKEERRRAAKLAEYIAAGCNCGPDGMAKAKGRHGNTCPVYLASPKAIAQAAAVARYVPMTR